MITDDEYHQAGQILERLFHEAECRRLLGFERLACTTSLQGHDLFLEAQQDAEGALYLDLASCPRPPDRPASRTPPSRRSPSASPSTSAPHANSLRQSPTGSTVSSMAWTTDADRQRYGPVRALRAAHRHHHAGQQSTQHTGPP